MLRTKGEAGTGNVVEAVRHARSVQKEIRMVRRLITVGEGGLEPYSVMSLDGCRDFRSVSSSSRPCCQRNWL